ncbi:MAG: glycosyltransferase [Hyphomicrobium sp.]
METKISCVICAYNEAPRISNVLSVVTKHPLIDETIVIDDGSTDTTAEKLFTYPGVNVITHDTNKGKRAPRRFKWVA